MFTWARQLVRLRPGRDLVVVFALTILLPGVLLAVFGVRALRQEGRLANQQIRERLELAAERAARDLERELREWQAALERIGQVRTVDGEMLPERIRRSVTEPGSGVIVFVGPQELRVWPERQLLYQPAWSGTTAPAEARPAGALAEAESLELRDKDYPRAALLYTRLLARARSGQRALLLHRLARTYRKAGRHEEALRVFRELELLPRDRIGALPADLIAKYEICSHWSAQGSSDRLAAGALEFYRGLVSGRWPLEKSRYLFYATSARRWLAGGPTPEEIVRLSGIEEQKRLLADAVATLLDALPPPARSSDVRRLAVESEAGTHLAVWRFGEAVGESHSVVLLLANNWLTKHAWPRTFAATLDEGFDVGLLALNGQVLFDSSGTDSRQAGQGALAATSGVEDSQLPLRVRVRPRDPAALSAEMARRQNLYVVMLVLVMALLGFGTYLTARVVKRELEIARLKSDFVSAVSHEFRSPLTGIRQLGEMLMRGRVPNDERRQEYYELITRESVRLARLVENVLDFSRMEEGRKEYRFERLEAGPWLRALVADFQSELPGNRISIVATIPDTLPPLIADGDALSCAVHNLLDNAIKYSPGSNMVWLDADERDGGVTIRVRDRGIGIDEADRRHIFEKFYRGGGEITRQVKGAGLGLSLVKHIVRAHGGQVEFESRPGEGTTFSIRVKAAPSRPPPGA